MIFSFLAKNIIIRSQKEGSSLKNLIGHNKEKECHPYLQADGKAGKHFLSYIYLIHL